MNKRLRPSCVFYALVCFLACGVLWGQFSSSPSRHRGIDFFPGLRGGEAQLGHGFFVGSNLPFLKPPRLGRHSSGVGFFGGQRRHPRTWGYFPGLIYMGGEQQRNAYSSRNFVEQWSGREPSASEAEPGGLEASPLLHVGMSEEEVSLTLGSPLRKTVSGEREEWHYSAYTLTFEAGVLVGLKD